MLLARFGLAGSLFVSGRFRSGEDCDDSLPGDPAKKLIRRQGVEGKSQSMNYPAY